MPAIRPEQSQTSQETAPEAPPAGAEVREQRVETPEELQTLAEQTAERVQSDVATEQERVGELARGASERIGVGQAEAEALAQRQGAEAEALARDAAAALAEASGGTPSEAEPVPRHASLWEKARAWRTANAERIRAIKERKASGEITKDYGKKGAVNAKFKLCASAPDACAGRYVARLRETGRPVPDEFTMQRILKAVVEGKTPASARDVVLVEEMSQELAFEEYGKKVEDGVTLGAEGIAADMFTELDLEGREELAVESLEQAAEAVRAELQEYVEKGYLNAKEMQLILETTTKFGSAYARAFQGKRFRGGAERTEAEIIQHAYEAMRDNARKIAFQTKLDKRVFSGSDHGTRHICEGCTHFSEQLMGSIKGLEGVDFKDQDEVLIRQIVIDHDIGYTSDAAQAKGGFEASKDHPCAGCAFVEANKDYYVDKYGEEGYEIIRDVVLNHSYAQSEYGGTRPAAGENELTYNRDLIRSVVSTVDAMGATAETKAMDMFRYPEVIDILQNVKLYAETHGGPKEMEPAALAVFKQDLNAVVDTLLADGKISEERAAGYRSAIENQFNPQTVEITLGQFTGVVREMKLTRRADGTVAPEIRMDVSRLAALVGDNFGDTIALQGFVKAMKDFGLTESRLQELGGLVRQLQSESDPARREALQRQLVYESERATFIIGERETAGLPDEREQERTAITERFEAFGRETIRSELRQQFERIRAIPPGERTPEMARALVDELTTLFELDDREAQTLKALGKHLRENIRSDQELSTVQSTIARLKSKSEKQRLRRYEEAAAADEHVARAA
ncbi:hypothetical protein HY635_00430 [Candidatus Uhrbacteria bacterium]|nr:hypothetical protein [Candidatus Uhrbacteria bacterium]